MSSLEDRIAKLEALVERQAAIIEAQRAAIAQKDAMIERLEARVAELEKKLGGGRPPSAPAAPRASAKTDSANSPGGQPGHKGHRRELLKPTSTTDCMPSKCRGCGEALPNRRDTEPLRHQVIDLPPVRPIVDEFRLHRVACRCGVVTCGRLPRGVPAGMMGPGLLALVSLLVATCHVSRGSVLISVFRSRVALQRSTHGKEEHEGRVQREEVGEWRGVRQA